jgi:putative serine protease PepD
MPPAGPPPQRPAAPSRVERNKKTPKPATRRGMIITAIVAGLIGALIILLVMPAVFGVNPYNLLRGKVKLVEPREEVKVPSQQTNTVSPTSGATDVSAVAAKVIPSIVNITVQIPGGQGIGSGVIYQSGGYILTNNHVVSGATNIQVTFASGSELPATVVGTDVQNDIAVVKVNKTGLPAIAVGNSANLLVGQLVVAVGSPLGFQQTVTSGIISALHRNVPSQSANGQTTSVLTDLIQTDASINPGNSGGALCDSTGALIGINTLIASQSGGSQGIGFAIPVNTAKAVADALIAGTPVSHPYIGVLGQTVSADVATQFNLPVQEGALVTDVVKGSPAEKAGIKGGDVIVSAANQTVKSIDDLIAVVRATTVGTSIPIAFFEGSTKKTANVTVVEAPKSISQ